MINTTLDTSATGKRYIGHRQTGNYILLFVGEFKVDGVSGTARSYACLGKACYVSHEGSKSMNITWELECPILAKFLKKTDKLAVG